MVIVPDRVLPTPIPAVRIDADDDVAVATRDLAPGEEIAIAGARLRIAARIPAGHKIALREIESGASVRKYGWPIGKATRPIRTGEHVHTHNLETALAGLNDLEFRPGAPRAGRLQPAIEFRGFRRANGTVGTRNEIWIFPTVGCVARTAEKIAAAADEAHRGRIDGVHAFTHPFGCSQLGDDLGRTRRLLAALSKNPNAGGVLLIGLGCESNQLDRLLSEIPGADRSRISAVNAQDVEDEFEAGLALVRELAERAAQDKRSAASARDLVVGVKCGGSDGFSGITANPLVGLVCDAVCDAGGRTLLTEIPEMFGAEHVLAARARDEATARAVIALSDSFRSYYLERGQPISENPSPGNIEGGITTLEEKSLGAVQKSGKAPVMGVLRYGDQVSAPGLHILEAPGNDAVSSTALVAAGANLLLFTTGRGTPLGFPVPTLKIATNSRLAAAKRSWIDFDAGRLLAGEPLTDLARNLAALVARIASGEPTCSERNGEHSIAIWKDGVTL